jgi:hypothetical protein
VDKIDHVYVEKFEKVEEKYRSMIKRFGCKFEASRYNCDPMVTA